MYITIVEMPEYIKDADRLLNEESQQAIKDFLAIDPKAGRLIQGTGGVRKLRWARPGSGKSGGVRVIYCFHNETIPLFLLNMFGKKEMGLCRFVWVAAHHFFATTVLDSLL